MSVLTPAEEIRASDFVLVASGREYRGWTSIDVSRSLDDCAATWSVSGTLRWPGEASALRFRPDAPVQIRLGSDLVLTGYVDTITIPTGTGAVNVSGRSKTGDLVDCSATPGQYKGLSLYQLAVELARPYGIDVVIDSSALSVGLGHTTYVRRGSSVFQVVEEQARKAGLLCTDDAQGRLCLVRAGGGRSATAVVVGENVLPGGEVAADSSRRYSTYRVRSQTAGSDTSFGAAVTQIDGQEDDPGLSRYRLLVIDAPGLDRASAQRRATWEAATRAGQSLTVRQSVPGWRQGDGRLWASNERVHYVDRESGIDGELLVRAVRYTVSSEGQVTELEMVPPEAYLVEKPAARGARKATPGAWTELEGGV